jgi:hypothetical protein
VVVTWESRWTQTEKASLKQELVRGLVEGDDALQSSCLGLAGESVFCFAGAHRCIIVLYQVLMINTASQVRTECAKYT